MAKLLGFVANSLCESASFFGCRVEGGIVNVPARAPSTSSQN